MFDDFFVRAVLAGLGISIVAAPLGCFVVWRRMAYFGETIAYSGLLGIALGFLAGINLTAGVIMTAIAMACLLAALQNQRAIPMDTLMGILAHTSLAAGVIAASRIAGARFDLMGYLFGDILAVAKSDLALIACGLVVVTGILAWVWPWLLSLTVNEELAEAEGVPVQKVQIVFILLMAVTVALAMKVVGILLITSMMIFPAAIARSFARTPEQMAVGAVIVAGMAVVIGLALSLSFDTAAGPSIVLALGAQFLLVAAPLLYIRGR